jgi:hypothetical protein
MPFYQYELQFNIQNARIFYEFNIYIGLMIVQRDRNILP